MSNDEWRTPPQLFNRLDKEFNFVADMAASHENHLCRLYYTQEVNSLSIDWAKEIRGIMRFCKPRTRYVFCNCPYSDPMPWVKHAAKAQLDGLGVVMLLNNDMSVGWFAEALKTVSEIRILIAEERPSGRYGNGRVAFLDAAGNPGLQNNKPQFILIFNPHKVAANVTCYVKKSEYD